MRRACFVIVFCLTLLSVAASAQSLSPGPTIIPPDLAKQPTLGHELFLVLIGAVLGGLLGPLLQVFDDWLGVTPGSRYRLENYRVQRNIETILSDMLTVLRQKADQPPPASDVPVPPDA